MVQKKDNLPVNTEPVVADGGTISYANEVIAIISGIAASEIEGIAGMVTAGGLGDIAIRYGYYRYQDTVMIATLVLIIILVQIIQSTCDLIAKKINHR